jgi:hypothetical protein
VDQAAAWLTELEHGKIVRMQTYSDRREALEAAGLSAECVHADAS